ncbi:2,5-diketo-D-gluconate reductase B [Halopenitus malekzadehii]|uniref:2,5-diketo-D-gluconate reductase B n=1 Tax=Halopenitus malekzadehii TaxID=1267564 RepID=A0A1H6I335_9EURY|nr:aldo/keto reductase [Halopenitus malekzadehii]SEH41905.1 2,5-diketo-D-gluconate reductase B [Halopenitus malekzadehii]
MLDEDAYGLGFGTYSLTDEDGIDALVTAIEAGYRHLDTARLYGNEEEVGEAIDRADVDRDELFVATKIAHFEEPEPTPTYVREGVAESCDRLGIDTIDLLYHHWPGGSEDIEAVLPVLDDLRASGPVERLGVSNYTPADLELADDLLDAPPYAVQAEMHPFLPQEELRGAVRDRDAYFVAYSPIAQGEVFDSPVIAEIAEKHGVNEAIVTLAWHRSKDVVPIPRSKTPAHIRSNRDALTLELDAEDVERIDAIDRRLRCEDPDWMEWS